MAGIDWGKIPWQRDFPWVNEGEILTELWDVNLKKKVDNDVLR
jgi:hypothetical protein